MGRVLRILLGVILLGQVAPVYFHVEARVTLVAVLLMLALLVVYSLLEVALSQGLVTLAPGLGAIVGLAILVALYIAGSSQAPVVGHGEGQLAAATFLAVSLVVAGLRADAGCEVMAIPGLIFRRHTQLACLVFSPLDWLERRWRGNRAA